MEKETSHNILQKVIFVFGLLVIIALLGYLSTLMVKQRGGPPELVITSAFQPNMRSYAYKVQIKNFGEEAAENAQIQLDLYRDGKVFESGNISVDYVPIQSTETAWITFSTKRQSSDSLVVASITFLKP